MGNQKYFDHEPNVGELFGIQGRDLSTYQIYDEDTNLEVDGNVPSYFAKSFGTNPELNNSKLEGKLLIFKYLGNDKCQELYTSKIVNLSSLKSNNAGSLTNFQDFLRAYNEIILNPLVISETCEWTDDEKENVSTPLFEVTDNFKLEFTKANYGHEEEIKQAIEALETNGKRILNNQFQELINFDYNIATAQDYIQDLENSLGTPNLK